MPLPDGIQATEYDGLIAGLNGNDGFPQSQPFREQCSIACRTLGMEHTPRMIFSVIGCLIDVHKGTIRKHSEHFKARKAIIWHSGRPRLFIPDEIGDILQAIHCESCHSPTRDPRYRRSETSQIAPPGSAPRLSMISDLWLVPSATPVHCYRKVQ
jgi:hypothetical protein